MAALEGKTFWLSVTLQLSYDSVTGPVPHSFYEDH